MTKIQGICEYCGVGHGEFACPSPRRKVVEAAAALEEALAAEALAAEALAKVGITPETIQAKIQEVAAEIPPDPAVEAEPEELLPVTQAAKVPAPPTAPGHVPPLPLTASISVKSTEIAAPMHVPPLPLTVTRVTSEMAEFSDGTAVLRQRPMHAKIKIPPMMTPDRFRFVFQVGDAIEECLAKLQSDGPAQVG